jgi:hypothetical protein
MQTVQENAIEDAWHQLHHEAIPEEDVQDLVDEFYQEQPVLMGFLLSMEDDVTNADDEGFFVLYGAWIWLAFKISGRDDRMVTEQAVEAAYQRNVKEMEELNAAGPSTAEAQARGMTKSYRQMPMLAAVLTEIMEGEMEGNRVDDLTGMLTLHLKTIIDCLDA